CFCDCDFAAEQDLVTAGGRICLVCELCRSAQRSAFSQRIVGFAEMGSPDSCTYHADRHRAWYCDVRSRQPAPAKYSLRPVHYSCVVAARLRSIRMEVCFPSTLRRPDLACP